MDRCTDKFIAVTDHLADTHFVAGFHGRHTGRTDMLLHRQHDALRLRHTLHRQIRRVFVMLNAHAAAHMADGGEHSGYNLAQCSQSSSSNDLRSM